MPSASSWGLGGPLVAAWLALLLLPALPVLAGTAPEAPFPASPAPPLFQVESFWPHEGGPGTNLTIRGTGLQAVASVGLADWNGIGAIPFRLAPDSSLVASIPSHPFFAGREWAVRLAGASNGSSEPFFQYAGCFLVAGAGAPPHPCRAANWDHPQERMEIVDFQPRHGPPGTVITVTGRHLLSVGGFGFTTGDSAVFLDPMLVDAGREPQAVGDETVRFSVSRHLGNGSYGLYATNQAFRAVAGCFVVTDSAAPPAQAPPCFWWGEDGAHPTQVPVLAPDEPAKGIPWQESGSGNQTGTGNQATPPPRGNGTRDNQTTPAPPRNGTTGNQTRPPPPPGNQTGGNRTTPPPPPGGNGTDDGTVSPPRNETAGNATAPPPRGNHTRGNETAPSLGVPAPPPPPVPVSLSWGASVLFALLAGMTDLRKLAKAAAFLPLLFLFSRLRKDRLLEHPGRQKIVDLVEADPGIHYQELVRQTGLGHGSVENHLGRLLAAGLLVAERSGGFTRYYPPSARAAGPLPQQSLLRSRPARQALALSVEQGALSLSGLAALAGSAASTMHAHVERLERAGFVSVLRVGREKRIVATEKGRKALQAQASSAGSFSPAPWNPAAVPTGA